LKWWPKRIHFFNELTINYGLHTIQFDKGKVDEYRGVTIDKREDMS